MVVRNNSKNCLGLLLLNLSSVLELNFQVEGADGEKPHCISRAEPCDTAEEQCEECVDPELLAGNGVEVIVTLLVLLLSLVSFLLIRLTVDHE